MAKQYFKPGNMLYPLPAVMVSCQYPAGKEDALCTNPALAGKPNIITVAWAGTVCTNPPMLSISVRPERYSYHMIEESGEFVVNLTTEQLVRATDFCGVRSGKDIDKFKEMHLTPLPSKEISAPGIAESPVNIECKVREIKPLGSHTMFLADVVNVTVDDKFFDEKNTFHLNDTGLVTYSHGAYFLLGKKLGTFGYSVAKKKAKKLKRKYEKEHASYEKKVQAYIDRYTVDDANQSCFSSDEDVVSTAAGAMITGMKSQGMATAVKTFPGTAPVARYHQLVPCQITTGLSKLRRENFSTFSAAIDAGTNMMMAGHVWLTKIDKDFPASLSSTILSDVVRKELGFEGVLFTEALNVPVITSQYSAEEAELKAVIAGADMLYNPVNVEEAVFHVSRAVMFDDIDEKQVDQAVLRILQDKIQQGIYHK